MRILKAVLRIQTQTGMSTHLMSVEILCLNTVSDYLLLLGERKDQCEGKKVKER